MTSFCFTVEQIRGAPPEVRRWLENEIVHALAAARSSPPPRAPEASLAACGFDAAMQVFELIRGDFLVTQVFFELARDTGVGPRAPGLYAFSSADILRHARIADGARLGECLMAITAAYREVCGNAEVNLFGFDDHGHIYLHEATHEAIRQVWEQLVAGHAGAGAASPLGFVAPRVGPAEDVAGHAGRPGGGD